MTTILGIGGTLRPGSSSELALRHALAVAAACGADVEMLTATDLTFPMYDPERGAPTPAVDAFLAAVRRADGVIVASPSYHGGISGLLKNAFDYLQELAADPAPYLDGRAVGCVVTAAGWQAGVATLLALRSTVHALRGWPTPMGVVLNSADRPFDADGQPRDPKARAQLTTLGEQVARFPHGLLAPAA